MTNLPSSGPSLSPFSLLNQLRPLRLGAICQIFNPSPLRLKALRLMYRFFPEETANWLTCSDWIEILKQFLNKISDQNWFELDLAHIEGIYRWVMEEGYPDNEAEFNQPDHLPDHLQAMAELLDYIPLKCYGFCDEPAEFLFNDISEHPPLHLLKILLGLGGHEIPLALADKMGGAEVFPEEWDGRDKEEAWLRLERRAPLLPEPLAWLVEMSCYACGETGNVILDNEILVDKAWSGVLFRWDSPSDLEIVRRAWAGVKPFLNRLDVFERHANTPENLRLILDLLTQEDDEWLRQRFSRPPTSCILPMPAERP